MSRLPDLLERAAGVPEPAFTFADVSRRAERRVARRRASSAGLAVAMAGALGIATWSLARDDTNPTEHVRTVVTPPAPAASTTPTGPVFDARTGTTLLFADGHGGLLSLDLDRRVVTRHALSLPSNVGSVLFRASSDLVLTSGQVWVAPMQVWRVPLSGPPAKIADATAALRATEPDLLWTVEQSSADVRPTLRLVNSRNGGVLEEARGLDPKIGVPQIGVAKQVAYATNTGVQVFDPLRQRVTHTFGTGPVFVGDASGALVSWCEQGTTEVHISDVDGGADVVAHLPAGTTCHGLQNARFSPSATSLAMTSGDAVVLIDTATGDANVVLRGDDRAAWGAVAWSVHEQLFALSADATHVGRYRVSTRDAQVSPVAGLPSAATFATATNDEMR
jgi:hypothetical protein